MIPGSYSPPVETDHGHGDLINAVYHAIRRHPNPVQMASYGKILAGLLADQAKLHAGGHASAPAGGTAAAGMRRPDDGGERISPLNPAAADYAGPPLGPMDDPISNAVRNRGHLYSAMPIRGPLPPMHGGYDMPNPFVLRPDNPILAAVHNAFANGYRPVY